MKGTIIKIISNTYTVQLENQQMECKARGKFRNIRLTPMVGDLVDVDTSTKYIIHIYPRKNQLPRPSVANVDQALIVISVVEPKLDLYLLDKLLLVIEYNQIKPIICFTKMDLLTDEQEKEIEPILEYYQSVGYEVIQNRDITNIKHVFDHCITVITGQSGVGKSSLLNRLNPHLQIKTDSISKALGRGKHTTRHTELLSIGNGLVVDTPGFSSLSLEGMTKNVIRTTMREFHQHQSQCQYSDCNHLKEKNCAIKELVHKGEILKTRYEHYQRFMEEIQYDKNIYINLTK